MTLIQKIILFISLSRLHPTNMKYLIKIKDGQLNHAGTYVRTCINTLKGTHTNCIGHSRIISIFTVASYCAE